MQPPTRLQQLQTLIAQNPNDIFLIYALALEYLKNEQLAQAIQTFETLVQSQPQYVATYYQLGKCYEKKQQYTQALQTYQQGMAVALTAKDHHTHHELQGAYNLLNDELNDDF